MNFSLSKDGSVLYLLPRNELLELWLILLQTINAAWK